MICWVPAASVLLEIVCDGSTVYVPAPPVPVPSAVTLVLAATPTPKMVLLTAIWPVKFGSAAVIVITVPAIDPVKTASV